MIKRKAKENTWFYFFNTVILILFSLMIIVPIWNILVSSVSSSSGLAGNGLVLWPKGFTWENYRKVFLTQVSPCLLDLSVKNGSWGCDPYLVLCDRGLRIE